MKKGLIAFLAVLVLVLSACQQALQPTGQEQTVNVDRQPTGQASYKVGVMLPLTGDAAAYGLPIQKAIKIAFDEINAKGGVNGAKLDPIYEDSKCNPKDGNAAAQKLVNVDKTKVIIGGVCSGETLGAAPITEAAKVVLISPSATSPDITKAGDFVFRVAPSDAFAGEVAAEYAFNTMGARKAAVVSETTDYAQGLRNVFKARFTELGGQIVVDETYNPEDTDFRTQATKVKVASSDVIYLLPQAPAKGLLLIKQLREAGVTGQLLTAEVLMGRNTVAENGADMEGLIGIEQKFDEKNPKAAGMVAKYKEQTNEEPAYMSGGYDIVYLIADAITKNGYDGEKIKMYLYGVKDYDGAVGRITMDENGDPIMEYSILQVKNGVLVPAQATPHK